MCSVTNLGYTDIPDSIINYFEKKTVSNHPNIKSSNEPEITMFKINSKSAQTAFSLRREEDVSVLAIIAKPYLDGCYQKITGSVLRSKEMPCNFYFNLIDLKSLEEVQRGTSSFLHLFEKKEIVLFISRFQLQVSNAYRIFNIKPLGRQTNRNLCLNELINEKNLLFLSYLRNAGPPITYVRKEPIMPKKLKNRTGSL